MTRPLWMFLTMCACLALAVRFVPQQAHVLVPVVIAAFFALGVWASVSLRSGLWCRAIWRAAGDRPQVALTYDDGPDPRSTPRLLDLLEQRGVRATFFCVGNKVRAHPELVRRMHAAGHELGNHSERHSLWTNFYSKRRLRAALSACQAALEEATGDRPRYFRPPFGFSNHATDPVARELGLRIVGWQVRGYDMPASDPERVSERVLARVRPGGIILLHDGERDPDMVVAATRAILDGLAERGLRAVSLPALLET